MAIDKAKDDKYFNQTQNDIYDEKDYIASQYDNEYYDETYVFFNK